MRESCLDLSSSFFFYKAVWVGDSSTSFPRLKFDLLTLNTIRLTKSIGLPLLVWAARFLVEPSLWVCVL